MLILVITYNVPLEGNQEKDYVLTSLETLYLKINTLKLIQSIKIINT